MKVYEWLWGKYGAYVILVFAVMIVAGTAPSVDQMQLCVPEPPAYWAGVVALTVFIMWSWMCCGNDHEENVDEAHPDGRLTYP